MHSIWIPALAWERRQRRPRCASECGGPLVHCVRAEPAVHTRSGGAWKSHDEVACLDQSASGTALGACMSPGLRRLCHRVAVRRQRRISPLARGDERSSVHSNRLEEGENNFTASAPSERRQAALRASPVAARLGPSPRGLARCTGRPLEHVLCARGRVTSRSH